MLFSSLKVASSMPFFKSKMASLVPILGTHYLGNKDLEGIIEGTKNFENNTKGKNCEN